MKNKYKKGSFGYWWTIELEKDDIKGKTYDGDIDCSFNELTSLEGAPKIVNGDFDCCFNNLTTLKEKPEIINGMFNCSFNNLLSMND